SGLSPRHFQPYDGTFTVRRKMQATRRGTVPGDRLRYSDLDSYYSQSRCHAGLAHRSRSKAIEPDAVPINLPEREAKRKRRRALALNRVQTALASAEPGAAVRAHFQLAGSVLRVDQQEYDLARYRHLYVVGGGKATAPMAQAVEAVLSERIPAGGVCVKYRHLAAPPRTPTAPAPHPPPPPR